jgi:hypothetical protein
MDWLGEHYNMSHFAKVENGVVTQVIVVNNAETVNADGIEIEHIGVEFCKKLFGGNWKQTSYNGNKRKNYAGIGFTFDAGRDAFIPPQPFPSWTLVEQTCQWTAPTPMPVDDKRYTWNEETLAWVEMP